MDLIGLTGGIASGKSTVARMLREAGEIVVDADQLARDVVEKGTPGLARIVETFGEGIVDEGGALDRKKLGAIVFGDDEKRRALNAIVHPLVFARFQSIAEEHAARGVARLVYEVPLLFENGLDALMKATILVAVDEETQLARLMARDGVNRAAALARVRAQMPLEAKRARATAVVENGGDRVSLRVALDDAWRAVTGASLARP